MAAAPSSAPFFGIRDEDHLNQLQQQSSSTPSSSTVAPPQPAPAKKRRNLPGTPYPDAEVIALSPKTLMATNRFICEVCNKGFQREQNLQLHRRGHNLPWKLKQKNPKDVRRRVYLCPEPTCVHHDPSRALGDLTGIKKHFCRKHGEKKWKCDKCSKRYAVQSDWKAHSKVCGTREYRCDCGTLFSRRDSFITHRAFCDALAQESARIPTGLNSIGSHLYGNGSMGLGLSQLNSQMSSLQDQSHPSTDLLRLGGDGGQYDHLISPTNPSSAFYPTGSAQDYSEDTQSHHSLLQSKPYHGLMHLPDLQSNASNGSSSSAANLFNLSFFSNSSTTSSMSNSNNPNNQSGHLLMQDPFNNGGGGTGDTTLYAGSLMSNHMYNDQQPLPQMSATALLQKAAQMGATTSSGGGGGSSLLRGYGSSSSVGVKPASFRASFGGGGGGGGNGGSGGVGGEGLRSHMESQTHLQDLMNSLSSGGSGRVFGESGGVGPFDGSCGDREATGFARFAGQGFMDHEAKMHQNQSVGSIGGGSDGLTRDFLGVGSMVPSMGRGMTQRELQHGIDMGSLEGEMKSPPSSGRSFAGGSLQ